MRLLIALALTLAAGSASVAGTKSTVSLAEACNMAVIVESGILPKTGPTREHLKLKAFCLNTLDSYMAKKCPSADGWKAAQTISLMDFATPDAKALVAACR